MLRPGMLACVVLLGVTTANAELPARAEGTVTLAPASGAQAASAPTYWVMMVTGEKDGAPWIHTTTPATLGGVVKDTGPWVCTYPATHRGLDDDLGFERMELNCSVGEAEVFLDLRCNFRNKAKAGKVPGKVWKRGPLQTLNLRRKGDPTSTITVSLRCDVDAAFSSE